MALTRRHFLNGAGTLALGAAFPPLLLARTGGTARLMVVVLRGALDGLAAAPPHGDRAYVGMRAELAIAAPGLDRGALALDDTFGLHPSLAFLHERYEAGEMVVVHAVASPYRDRSHFDGQTVLENGMARPAGAADGWLNRALGAPPALNTDGRPERAVAISQNVPLLLRGTAPVLSKSPKPTPDIDGDLVARLADLYSNDDWFSARLSEALQGEQMAMENGSPNGSPEGSLAAVPAHQNPLTGNARMAATLMAGGEGPEVAVMEATGWDTHANQGAVDGALALRLRGLDDSIRVFADGMGSLWRQTVVMVVTEFGRTAAVNGTRGTDHGTGGCAFLVGGAVRGGRVIADWPGLGRSALLEGRDLRPTIDLRSVFKGILGEHMRIDDGRLSGHVFPESKGARPLEGLIRA